MEFKITSADNRILQEQLQMKVEFLIVFDSSPSFIVLVFVLLIIFDILNRYQRMLRCKKPLFY